MTRRTTKATTCPLCGGRVQVEDAERLRAYVVGGFQVIGRPLELRREACRVRACSTCEFIEIDQ